MFAYQREVETVLGAVLLIGVIGFLVLIFVMAPIAYIWMITHPAHNECSIVSESTGISTTRCIFYVDENPDASWEDVLEHFSIDNRVERLIESQYADGHN